MFRYYGIVVLLKGIVAVVDLDYKYDDYTDDGYALNGEDYVYNETMKAKPIRIELNGMNTDDAETIFPRVNETRQKREYTFINSPVVAVTATIQDPRPKDSIATYPFAASVLRMGSHYASGALVDRRWVLTAAGVFYNVRESIKLYRVRLGSLNCKKGGILLALQKIVIHSDYTPGRPECDLAMIRLAQPVDFNRSIHPVRLTEKKGRVEKAKFLTMYWPRVIVNGKPLPETAKERTMYSNMRVSTQRMMSWDKCLRALSSRKEMVTEKSMCLRPLKQHHTTCLPDVGAPVVSKDGLWGIISGWVGKPCTFSDPSPVMMARISPAAVRQWIELLVEREDV